MKYKITFSQVPSLQRITYGPERFEAVYHGPGRPIDIWADTKPATLPERVMYVLARRFDEVHAQDPETREFYLMEAKPCSI
jgi:hypothetical protein